jgi:DNA excision repair protein ERCC-4
MVLKPCTLEVGDYILSPKMCVERKSVSDLVQSLKSGRLYVQSEAMCVHYPIPILLIEFSQGKSFSLVFGKEEPGVVDTPSRLILLLIHFPKLRVIWSYSPSFTAEVFQLLKVNFTSLRLLERSTRAEHGKSFGGRG